MQKTRRNDGTKQKEKDDGSKEDLMPRPSLDEAVIIAGGGLIGPLMALALARTYGSIYLIDPTPLSHQLNTPSDGRAIAITQASKTFFEELDLWPLLAPHAEPLLTVFTQDNSGTEMRLGTENAFHQPLGYMVDSKILRDTLLTEVHKNPHIECLVDQVYDVKYQGAFDALVWLTLASGNQIMASLLIGADGARSGVRRAANLRTYEWSYDQKAFVRVYHHTNPHHGQAYEKFLRTGPFAILPLPHNRSSIVWTVTQEKAAQLGALSDDAFDQEAFSHMAEYKDLSPASPLWERPLKGLWVPFFTTHRVALIGDAAHLIHPLAGQGFNLGIQDVSVLTKTLAEARTLGFDMGSHTVLKRYEQAQRGSHLGLLGVTHGLNGLFSSDEKILKWIQSRGLAFIEKTPALKDFFAQQGTGIHKPSHHEKAKSYGPSRP